MWARSCSTCWCRCSGCWCCSASGATCSCPRFAQRAWPSPSRPLPRNNSSPAGHRPLGLKKSARQRPTLPPGYPGSTIGAGGLNFRVRKGNGCLPSAIVTEPGNYTGLEVLPRAAAAGAKALDLAGLRRRDVVRTASHLAHESLFLHLAAELAQRLLELLWILDDYSHNPTRIQAPAWGLLPLPDGREA